MAIAEVVQSVSKWERLFPVSGAGANIPVGTILMPGATGGTNLSILIPATATSNARCIGLLNELHKFSASGDATTATLVDWFYPGQLGTGNTAFPSHPVELFDNAVTVRYDYSLASTVAVASASSATLTITSFEANFDGGWVYVNAGTGIGQILFVASSSSGSCVLTSAATTQLDSTSKLTKVLPHFYETPVWLVNTTTAPTQLNSTAAAGTGRAVTLAQMIQRNGIEQRLNPKSHHNNSGLNSLNQFALYAFMCMQNTAFTPNS